MDSQFFTPGVRLMFMATLGFTGMQIMIKELSSFHVSQILFFRSSITALFCFLVLMKQGVPLIGKKQTFLIMRAVFGVTSISLFIITVQRMPLGASVSIKYLSPIFTAIFAVLFINEKLRLIQWLLFFTALFGVFLLKGFDARIDTLSLILGVLGAVLGGAVYVVIRRIGNSEHPLVIVNYFMTLAMILSGVVMIFYWKNPTWVEWIKLLFMGFCGYLGQNYMTRSFQLEAASRVAPIKYMELVYSLIIGFFWFGEGYTILAFIGILMILGSMMLNLMFKHPEEKLKI